MDQKWNQAVEGMKAPSPADIPRYPVRCYGLPVVVTAILPCRELSRVRTSVDLEYSDPGLYVPPLKKRVITYSYFYRVHAATIIP
jgi:hypothetical protein